MPRLTRGRRLREDQGGRGVAAAALALAMALLILLVAGCSTAGNPPPAEQAGQNAHTGQAGPPESTVAPDPPAPEGKALARSEPAWIEVPRIEARSSLISLGLNPDRTIAVPPVDQPMQASWYKHSPTPGESGPAVILGHVNGDGRDGIFARLHELRAGDEIRIGRRDGQIARFVVERMAQLPKSRFPADEVYGNTAGPELRLITCGGAFDEGAQSYRDNVLAFATFTGVVGAGA